MTRSPNLASSAHSTIRLPAPAACSASRVNIWQKMRKSMVSKRKELSAAHIDDITRIFGNNEEVTRDGVPISRIFKTETFGYRTITVERPERDAAGAIVLATKGKTKGKPVPDSALRDTENVPLSEDVNTYFAREILPHASDAWIDPWVAHLKGTGLCTFELGVEVDSFVFDGAIDGFTERRKEPHRVRSHQRERRIELAHGGKLPRRAGFDGELPHVVDERSARHDDDEASAQSGGLENRRFGDADYRL